MSNNMSNSFHLNYLKQFQYDTFGNLHKSDENA